MPQKILRVPQQVIMPAKNSIGIERRLPMQNMISHLAEEGVILPEIIIGHAEIGQSTLQPDEDHNRKKQRLNKQGAGRFLRLLLRPGSQHEGFYPGRGAPRKSKSHSTDAASSRHAPIRSPKQLSNMRLL